MTKHKETMKHKRFWQKIVFARCKKIDNNKEAKKKDEHKLDVKKFLGECIHRFKMMSAKWQKFGWFLNGQIVANTELQNKQDLWTCEQYVGPYFCTIHTMVLLPSE